jgi:hypothetical protein
MNYRDIMEIALPAGEGSVSRDTLVLCRLIAMTLVQLHRLNLTLEKVKEEVEMHPEDQELK